MLESIFIAFAVICGIQAFFYVAFTIFFPKKKSKKNNTSNFQEPVSIIICAKNESENLKNNLHLFEQQVYPNFELVLINDNSKDDSLEIMESFKAAAKIPVRIVNIVPTERFWGNKKYALTLGIKAASFEQLLFTDADCIPVSENWISEMTSNITSSKHIILGYGAYKKIKGSFLNKIIRFETAMTAIQYLSYASLGIPYMGVGRNLSYDKKTFFNARGFMDHMHIKSGDDDLFINQVATKKNTVCQISSESFTESIPKKTWNSWILQKRRHISTAHEYKNLHKVLLGLFHLSQVLFFVIAPILLILNFKIEYTLALVLFRYLLFYIVLISTTKKLSERDLLIFAPFLELFLLFTQIYIFIQNLISKPNHW